MRIFAERIIDPTSIDPTIFNIRFVSGCWRASINLTYFISKYPITKIKKVLAWIPEASRSVDVITGFSQFFDCLDYLSKSCNNENKSFIKKLQKLNDYAMGLQSLYRGG